jgi:hypothetical protein
MDGAWGTARISDWFSFNHRHPHYLIGDLIGFDLGWVVWLRNFEIAALCLTVRATAAAGARGFAKDRKIGGGNVPVLKLNIVRDALAGSMTRLAISPCFDCRRDCSHFCSAHVED